MALHESVKLKPGFSWRIQDVRNTSGLGYLPRRAVNREWKQPKMNIFLGVEGRGVIKTSHSEMSALKYNSLLIAQLLVLC